MNTPPSQRKFSGYEKFVIAMLAFLQFTLILDFMILSPLGAVLMPELKISAAQFGFVVSVYAFSAGISGILAAGFADRYDRKRLLLFFYGGFLLGTLFCGIAESYEFLLFARMVTGIFGGVIGSIVFAIATDLFPMEIRGRVMGYIQTAFAASQVLGLPLGLYLSNHWGWHAPFIMIVAGGLLVGAIIVLQLKPITGHLKTRVDRHAFHHLIDTLRRRDYLQAFAATALLSTGGFMIMPFSSAFSVNNLGVALTALPLVYMVTGVCNIFAGPLIGRLADSMGKFRTFTIGSLSGIVMVIIYTNLGLTPLPMVILVSVLMFVTVSSRMISSSAIMSGIPDPTHRGSFMAIGASIQQISGGIAAAVAGLIVVQKVDGPVEHFDILGYVVAAASIATLFMMYKINKMVMRRQPNLK